jgi:DNA-binding NarL/FixJ family response regulator
VLLVSGYDKERAGERFLGRGVVGFLYKPYEPEEFVACVRRAVEARGGASAAR